MQYVGWPRPTTLKMANDPSSPHVQNEFWKWRTTPCYPQIEISNDPVLQFWKWRTTPSSRLVEMSDDPVLQFWKWRTTPLSRVVEMSDDPVRRIWKSRMTPLLPGRKISHDPVANFPAPLSHKFWPVPYIVETDNFISALTMKKKIFFWKKAIFGG